MKLHQLQLQELPARVGRILMGWEKEGKMGVGRAERLGELRGSHVYSLGYTIEDMF